MPKLCQIIAVATGRKSVVQKEVTKQHQMLQKPALLDGISRTYTPSDAEGETLPAESKKVQLNVNDAIKAAAAAWTSIFDVVATQDAANCKASADVIVGGFTIIENVPVTHLLFLEKQLVDIHTFIDKLPTLDAAQDWTYDENKGCFKTEPTEQIKTKKHQKPVVMYEATKEHPAQVQLVGEDITVGKWTTVYFSGAIPADKKRAMLEKVQKLQDAVKFAREQANTIDVEDVKEGEQIFEFITA